MKPKLLINVTTHSTIYLQYVDYVHVAE